MPRLITKKTKKPFQWNMSLKVAVLLILVVAVAITLWISQKPQNIIQHAQAGKKVIGYYVSWDQTRGWQTIQNNVDVFSEISPWGAYIPDNNGNVVADPAGDQNVVSDTVVSYLKSHNILVTPAIHNLIHGTWNYNNIVSNIINNSSTAQAHINNIVNLVVSKGYDGIDIDYENLNGSNDRTAYSNFLTNLATALHAQGKILTTDVYGKTSEPGSWSGQIAQDYKAIGNAADEVRIMFYDYNPATVGPIAPYKWINNVLSFAPTEMAPTKIIQGVGVYGYDWAGSSYPTDLTWTDVQSKIQQTGATPTWDSTNYESWFTYNSNGTSHTIWFEDARSTNYKLDLTNNQNVAGVHFWRLGGEDPGTWVDVRTKFPLTSTTTATATPTSSQSIPTVTMAAIPSLTPTILPSQDTVPPTISITSPANNSQVYKKTSIQTTASDNVGIKSVAFYVDGTLISTDSYIPYNATWNSRLAQSGPHSIQVVATDTSGNSSSAQITVYK